MASPQSQWLDKTIDGRYHIIRLLNEGGMGVAYLAEQIDLSRKVVIKVLQINLSNDAEERERFLREAQVLGSLHHKNLVQVYGVGIYAEEFPYITMEYVEGKTLNDEIFQIEKINWKRTLAIALQICEAMEYCHQAGVIHRDLKPENIILEQAEKNDIVKIIDFGLAKVLGGSKATLTATGLLLGSPRFMSPESCEGQRAKPASDVYSLGCVLYACLTGKPPFNADSAFELFTAHKTEIPIAPRTILGAENIPKDIDALVLKSLEKAPENRYQSMAEFAENIAAVLDGKSLKFSPSEVSYLSKKKPPSLKAYWLALVGLLVCIALAGTALLNLHPNLKTKTSRRAELDQSEQDIKRMNALLDKLDTGLKTKDKGTFEDIPDRILSIFIRELMSNRDYEKCFKDELLVMNRIQEHATIFSNQPHIDTVKDATRFHFVIPDRNPTPSILHMRAQFNLLQAKIFEPVSGFIESTIASYCNAAYLFYRSGEPDKAEYCLNRAQRISKRLNVEGGPAQIARSSIELAKLMQYCNDVDTKAFEQGAAKLRTEAKTFYIDTSAQTMVALGYAYLDLNLPRQAESCFEEAQKVHKEKLHGLIENAFIGEAQAYELMHDYPKAIAKYESVMTVFKDLSRLRRDQEISEEIDRMKALMANSR